MKKILVFIFLALLLPVSAFAQVPSAEQLGDEELSVDDIPYRREVSFGHLALVPSLTLQQVYNDNIYFGNGHNSSTELKESDWIRHAKPGLLFDWELNERGNLKLGYDGDIARHAVNTYSDWRRHQGLLDLDYFTPGGLIVKIKNTLIDTEDPYGSLNEYGLGRKKKRWTNRCATAAGFQFSEDFKALAYYNFFKQRYADRIDFTQNYTSAEFGAGGEVKTGDKTWLFLRGFSGRQGYDTHREGVSISNDASYSWKKVTTGLTWDSEARFQGELNIGYQWHRFDNSRDRNGLPYNDKSTWIADTSIDFKPSAVQTISLTFTRDLRQLSSGQNAYFINTTLGLGLRQLLTPRLALLAGCGYTKNKYNSDYSAYDGRNDSVRFTSVSMHYLLSDWVSVGVGYRRLTDHSNIAMWRYRVNEMTIALDFNPAFLDRRPPQQISGEE